MEFKLKLEFFNATLKNTRDFFEHIEKRWTFKLDVFYALHEAYAKAIGQDLKNIGC